MKKQIKIGILGGIGPEATNYFYGELIRRLQKSGIIRNNTDFPQIIINSIPAPELTHSRIAEDDLTLYCKGLKELAALEPDFIVMVCNTIHLFYNELQKSVEMPIIDLRELVKRAIIKKGYSRITVIGTPATVKDGLYTFENFAYNNPDRKELHAIGQAIKNFNLGISKEKQCCILLNIAKKYLEKSDCIITACTEVSLMLQNETLPLLDTMELLIEEVVARVIEHNKRKL